MENNDEKLHVDATKLETKKEKPKLNDFLLIFGSIITLWGGFSSDYLLLLLGVLIGGYGYYMKIKK